MPNKTLQVIFHFLLFGILLTANFALAQDAKTDDPATEKKPAAQAPAKAKADAEQSVSTGVSDWTQWRGPNRDAIIKKSAWPDSIDEKSLTQRWSIPLNPSYSGPIVVGDHVYTTETENRQNEVVICLNRETGKEVWRQSWAGAMKMPFFAAANGDWIRSTPAYSDGRLYVSGILENFACLDAKSGDVLWMTDFPAKLQAKRPSFGGVCSPMIEGDFVYMQTADRFIKLDKKTGAEIWSSLKGQGGMMSGGFFSSPSIATVAGKKQALVQTRTTLAGVDLEDGKVLWTQQIAAMRGMNILTPTAYKDFVFTSAHKGTTQLWEVSKSGESFGVSQKWQLPAQAYMGSPVIVDGHAYIQLGNKRFACFDLENGEETWRSRRGFGKYASLVASGDKILALDESGKLLLIRANPKSFELIGERNVGNNNWAHLAVRGNQIFVRGLKDLRMYDWTQVE